MSRLSSLRNRVFKARNRIVGEYIKSLKYTANPDWTKIRQAELFLKQTKYEFYKGAWFDADALEAELNKLEPIDTEEFQEDIQWLLNRPVTSYPQDS